MRGSQLVLMSVVRATFESWRAGVSNIGIWRLRTAFQVYAKQRADLIAYLETLR